MSIEAAAQPSSTSNSTLSLDPVRFYKALADETRLRCLLLIAHEKELCVCELTEALRESQPKISRHLAILRESEVLIDRRHKQWVYYQVNPKLPTWAHTNLSTALDENTAFIEENLNRLLQMGDRPERLEKVCA